MVHRLIHGITVSTTTILAVIVGFVLHIYAIKFASEERDKDYALRWLDESPYPTVVCVNNKVRLWNHAAEQNLGYKKEEVYNKSPIGLMPPDLIDEHQYKQEVLEDRPVGTKGYRYLIIPMKHKNGKFIKHLVTVTHVKEPGELIVIARVVDHLYFPPYTWYDVATKQEKQVALLVDGQLLDPFYEYKETKEAVLR